MQRIPITERMIDDMAEEAQVDYRTVLRALAGLPIRFRYARERTNDVFRRWGVRVAEPASVPAPPAKTTRPSRAA